MLHGAFEAVAAKPTESFLSTVGKNHYGKDDPQDETRHPTVSLQQPLKHRHRGLPFISHECSLTRSRCRNGGSRVLVCQARSKMRNSAASTALTSRISS